MSGLLATLLVGLFIAQPDDVYVCNPFSTPQQGWIRLSASEGLKVDSPPLACVRIPFAPRPAPKGKAIAGLLLARRNVSGMLEILVEPPRRAYVLDVNRNGRPDFAGDRWLFDADGDGLAETIVAMTDSNGDGRADQIAFYLSGEYDLGVRAKLRADARSKSAPAETGPKRRLSMAEAASTQWNPGTRPASGSTRTATEPGVRAVSSKAATCRATGSCSIANTRFGTGA
jgi:hypothetical protein